MRSYVVRIYRDSREEITGLVEIPEQDSCLAFHNFDELKHILTEPGAIPPASGDKSGGNR